MSNKYKLTCGTRTESRCVDYEGEVCAESPLNGEDNLTAHDAIEDLYTLVSANKTNFDLFAPIESPTFTGVVSGITKSMIGLSEV